MSRNSLLETGAKSEVSCSHLELLTDIDMLSMVEKSIGGGICHAIHRYAKAKNIKNIKNIYSYKNILFVWAMSQNLPINNLE